MESRRGLFSARAFANASGPHVNQSTGLWACWSKYGLVSWMRRLVGCSLMINLSAPQTLASVQEGRGSWSTQCVVADAVAGLRWLRFISVVCFCSVSDILGDKRRPCQYTRA